MTFMFWIAWPEAPFTRLSITAGVGGGGERGTRDEGRRGEERDVCEKGKVVSLGCCSVAHSSWMQLCFPCSLGLSMKVRGKHTKVPGQA